MLDALKRASVKSVSVVLPYYPYARQDRVDRPGKPIAAKLIANLLARAGADRLITIDLHSEQIEGFFDIPVLHLQSQSCLFLIFLNWVMRMLSLSLLTKERLKLPERMQKNLRSR